MRINKNVLNTKIMKSYPRKLYGNIQLNKIFSKTKHPPN